MSTSQRLAVLVGLGACGLTAVIVLMAPGARSGSLPGRHTAPVQGTIPLAPVALDGLSEPDLPASVPETESPRAALAERIATPIDSASTAAPTCSLRLYSDVGLPLAAARIRSTGPKATFLAETDSRGEADLPLPEITVPWRVEIDAAGHFHHRSVLAQREALTLQLSRAVELVGVCVDQATGATLQGVELTFVHAHCNGCADELVTSDEEGHFAFPALPLDTDLALSVHVSGYAARTIRFRLTATDAERECRIELQRSKRFAIAAFDAVTNTPIASAELVPSGERAGPDGRIQIERALDPDGTTLITVRAPGYLTTTARRKIVAGSKMPVPLLAGASITGHVRDAAGTPVSGATVTATEDLEAELIDLAARTSELPREWIARPELEQGVCTTGEAGVFALRGLVPRSRYVVTVTREGFEPFERKGLATSTPGQESRVAFKLFALPPVEVGTWRGRALRDGAPVAAHVSCDTARSGNGSRTTGDDGAFEFNAVPIGGVFAWAEIARVKGPRRVLVIEVPRQGVLEQDIDLSFELALTTGRVRAPDGDGLAGVTVVAEGSWLAPDGVSTATDATGAFAFVLPVELQASYTLTATQHGYKARADNVRAGAQDVDLVLPRLVHTRIRVVEAGTARPLDDWRFDATVAGRRLDDFERIHGPAWGLLPTLDGWYVVPLPEGTVIGAVGIRDATVSVTHEATLTQSVETRWTFEFPPLDEVELQLRSVDDNAANRHVFVTPAAREDEVRAAAYAGKPMLPRIVDSGRGVSGGRASEAIRALTVRSSTTFRLLLRRGVDYVLVAADPEVVVEPATIPAESRMHRSSSASTLRRRP